MTGPVAMGAARRLASSATQDDGREQKQITRLRLIKVNDNRIGVDGADELGNPHELKTSSRDNGVSSARALSPDNVRRWRKMYWVFTKGHYVELTSSDGTKIKEWVEEDSWFLAPIHMEPWFLEQEAKFATAYALRDKVLAAAGDALTEEEHQQVTKYFFDGMRLNDPDIPWSFIREHGTRLEGDHAEHLRELTAKFPIAGLVVTSQTLKDGRTVLVKRCAQIIAEEEAEAARKAIIAAAAAAEKALLRAKRAAERAAERAAAKAAKPRVARTKKTIESQNATV